MSDDRLLTPSDHYEQAQEALRDSSGFPWGSPEHTGAMAQAQVHATLATVRGAVYQELNEKRIMGSRSPANT